MNKNTVYISFVNDQGKLSHEYIPQNSNKLTIAIINYWNRILVKLGIEMNYWNLRHLLDFETRKTEDLLFIIHVLEEHDGGPSRKREKMFYKKMRRLYGPEIDTLIKPLVEESKSKDPIVHPYYLAYKKRWLRKKYSESKRFYHGLDAVELDDLFSSLIKRIQDESKRNKSKSNYYKRALLKPSRNKTKQKV